MSTTALVISLVAMMVIIALATVFTMLKEKKEEALAVAELAAEVELEDKQRNLFCNARMRQDAVNRGETTYINNKGSRVSV